MWTSALLKSEAKRHLKDYYWMAFAVCLVAGILSGMGSGGGGTGASFDFSSGDYYYDTAMAVVVIVTALIIMAVSMAISAFLANVVEVGMYRFFMESRVKKSQFDVLFYGFQRGGKNYLNIVKILFFRDVKVFLWSLLLIFPGIIKSYEYRMVPYILSERPDMPTARAFELSRMMTDGEKMNLFVLDLSFIGWFLLGMLACCVGTLFVNPYFYATWAELYTALREKAFGLGLSNPEELIGFAN